MISVNVKWGKQKFDNIELDSSESPMLFKMQLFALTSVPVERMKVMGLKGGPLKDEASWGDVGLKPGMNLMLMGTAETLAAPAEKAVFVEDMPMQGTVEELSAPAGLANLGNTCYLNSSLQVMRAIPELESALKAYKPTSASEPGAALVLAQRDVLAELERGSSVREVMPMRFVSAFRQHFPRFAEQGEQGGYAQQDAEECWSSLISNMASRVRLPDGPDSNSNLELQPAAVEGMLQDNAGDVLFGLQIASTFKCAEEGAEEAPTHTRESMRRLACHLKQGCAHLYNAIELSLEETVDKRSQTLGREAQYTKSSKISRLPPYLPVQFVRFAWRADSQKRCKVLKEVSFPEQLDLRNLLAPGLTKRVNAHWRALEAQAVREAGASAMEVEGAASSSAPAEAEVFDPADELPAAVRARDNLTGRYELFAIVTHEGRTAEGGHYVAWVKEADDEKGVSPGWLVFDDETVARVPADKIKKLHGGGDYHMAYMYAPHLKYIAILMFKAHSRLKLAAGNM